MLLKNLMLTRKYIIGYRAKQGPVSYLFHYLVFRNDLKYHAAILKFKNWIKIYIYLFTSLLWAIFVNDIAYSRSAGVIYPDTQNLPISSLPFQLIIIEIILLPLQAGTVSLSYLYHI